MDLLFRRRATKEELSEGERQILMEHERLKSEGLEEQPKEAAEGSQNAEERLEKMIKEDEERRGKESLRAEALEVAEAGVRDQVRTPARDDEEGKSLWPGGPSEAPAPRGPVTPVPLFNEDQLRRLEDLERQAPLLIRREPEVMRPDWLKTEELKKQEAESRQEVDRQQLRIGRRLRGEDSEAWVRRAQEAEQRSVELIQQRQASEKEVMKKTEEILRLEEEQLRLEKENLMIAKENAAIAKENEMLRRQVRLLSEKVGDEPSPANDEGRFATPEEERKSPAREKEEAEIGGTKKEKRVEMSASEESKPMDLMIRMMNTMQKMVEKEGDKKVEDKGSEVETVRYGQIDLPKLQDWCVESAPLDLGDWLTQVEPIMGDLTATSNDWWSTILEEARGWYQDHQGLGPMDRLTHDVTPSEKLKSPRWGRLERRVTSLLLASLPEAQKDEMIATKTLSPLGIISKLMVAYQPGGVSEKGIILRNLENPPEAATLAGALTSLRRWLRWKRRAEDVGVALPDATIMIKGINKITRKILENHKELNFRISLARTTLMVESVPRMTTVNKFAEHLVAEVEQVVHLDLKAKKEDPKVAAKRFENEGGAQKGYGKGRDEAPSSSKREETCRFFLTDGGCKKGRSCEWKHVLDEQRRCWTCGGKDHLANNCPRADQHAEDSPPRSFKGEGKGGGKGKEGKGAARFNKKDEVKSEAAPSESERPGEAGAEAETMKSLLEEANKMLRSISAKGDEDDKIQRMQKQLEDLRRMKVLRLTRMVSGPAQGLLDSGATNPLRPMRSGEDLGKLEEVMVTLATGEKVAMRMTASGVMVTSNQEVEPILPLGMITGELGYEVVFKGRGCRLLHPNRGEIKVDMVNGCPQIQRQTALKLIQEIEERGIGAKKLSLEEKFEEKDWIVGLIDSHPVLRRLPPNIREALKEEPAVDLRGLPECNRRRRKVLDQGFVVSIYAGKKEGYWLGRAVKEVGGDPRRVLEVDIERDEGFQEGKHDMLRPGGVYASLLRAALDGKIKGVLTAPNCRSRSVLRHYPLPHGGPRPVRSWDHPWGKEDLTREEKRLVEEDDILLWRSLMIYIVSEEMRKVHPEGDQLPQVKLGLEQPADPTHYMPEVVTLWKTEEWLAFRRMYHLKEQTFNQSSWGGKAKKPTTFAGNLSLQLPEGQQEKEIEGKIESSKELARWAPGFMKEVAIQLQSRVFLRGVRIQVMSWEEHVRRGHTPFRRDCQICQEASARARMHHPTTFPRAGILTLDVSGPYTPGHDVEEPAKFMLIGAYTWLKSSSSKKEDEKGEDEKREEEVEDEAVEGPQLEVLADEEEGVEAGVVEDEEEKELREGDDDHGEEEKKKEDEAKEEEVEERQDPVIEVIRVGVPIPGKTKEVVLEAVAEIYLQLRVDGFFVHSVHTDQGREFVNRDMKAWLRSRGIIHSTNAGEDPKANGRAERAVGEAKSRVRRLLHAGKMDLVWWPMALRFAMETERLRRRGTSTKRIPGFGDKVIIRRRNWKTKLLEPTHEETTYLCPVLDAHGHCVLRGDGKWGIAPYVIKDIQRPQLDDQQVWIGFLEEADRDEMRERRRIRGKQSIRVEEGAEMVPLRRLLREEAENLEMDSVKNSRMMFKKLAVIKKIVKGMEEEEQQILQTKIISPNEMVREVHLWDDAIRSEMKSLLEEKQALRMVESEEKKEMERSGRDLEVVPSKLVITRKAGGRRKVRIVACGNFIPKKEEEDLFASGSDAVGVRVALKMAAQSGWEGTSIDIKTAFLNAPLPVKEIPEGGEEPETVVLLKPPPLLVKLGYVKEGTWWMALRAMYGLRQSPKVWGDHRDRLLSSMEWRLQEKTMWLEQAAAEPNMWKVVSEREDIVPLQRGLAIVLCR